MQRARKHQVLLARLALLLLALIAELLGRSLTHRLNVGRHVAPPSYSGADYYPFLLAAVKVGVALMLARVAWRVAKARSTAVAAHRVIARKGRAAAAHRVIARKGRATATAPRVRLELSPKLWLGSFVITSVLFLLQNDVEQFSTGHLMFFAPWLHTSALPVFAVLAVVVAVIYGAVTRWLAAYESYARETAAYASRLERVLEPAPHARSASKVTPRALFGLAFESRPPPVPA